MRTRLAAVMLALLAACAAPPRPRCVILFIGDGMGHSQVTLGRMMAGGPDHRLTLDDFPVTGLSRVHSADAWVTDSAASATALASGTRTNNFMIGQAPDGSPLPTVADRARERGRATGIVTTARITHATPAGFAAHVPDRNMEAEIALQYPDSGIDVFLGGGGRYFDDDLRTRFAELGYSVATSSADLAAATGPRVLGLFASSHIPYVLDRGDGVPSLPDMTRRAIELLSQDPDGFFLMVEGGRIDHACHSSDAPSAAREMIEFDDAVLAALEWARNRRDVLIVVTADHCTGGLAITEKIQSRREAYHAVRASSERITREAIRALPEHRLGAILAELAGVTDSTDAEIEEFYRRLPAEANQPPYDSEEQVGRILSARMGVTFVPFEYRRLDPDTTHGHDGAMVPIYAWGAGAARFTGTLDLTDIPARLIE